MLRNTLIQLFSHKAAIGKWSAEQNSTAFICSWAFLEQESLLAQLKTLDLRFILLQYRHSKQPFYLLTYAMMVRKINVTDMHIFII